ncbi:hypothetical protein D3C86_2097060 [compost metagenome]
MPPSFALENVTAVTTAVVRLALAGCEIVTFNTVLQPLASVTVTLYGPAARPEAVAPVPPPPVHW